MVCLGNICRSPMAEGIVREEFRLNGIQIEVDSAGTAAYHQGESADMRAQLELQKHGIDISDERAQSFKTEFFKEYDLIFAMDHANYRDILRLTTNEKERRKVNMLMNLVSPNANISIPDPYYGGSEGFIKVYEMIKRAAEVLVTLAKSNKLKV